jgi:hypothetical protein
MKLEYLFTMPLSVASHSLWRLLYKTISITPFSNPFLNQIATKSQKDKKQNPLGQGKKNQAFSNQTGS